MRTLRFFHHARRLCACGCGRRFQPSDTISPVSTERYKDGAHALRAIYRRKGFETPLTVPDLAPGPNEDGPLLRWGPLREIGRIIEDRPASKRVSFVTCGHEATILARLTKSRCRRCLRGGRLT